MAKDKKNINISEEKKKNKKRSSKVLKTPEDCLWSMKQGNLTATHWFQMIPAIFFTSVVILIVRMHEYKLDMSEFYWMGSNSDLTDFFSYHKMTAILGCAIFVLLILLYKIITQSMTIKRCFAYIPIAAYSFFVFTSYLTSEYKEFSLLGWIDRFEGTLPLLCYMLLLFYIINAINSEKAVRWMIYSLAVSSTLLSLVGLSQAWGHDFFQTNIGKMLITPSWYWDSVDSLIFNFKAKEIYQTLYNINYVSFYLTLLIPLFGMLFLYSMNMRNEEKTYKKIIWAALFALLIFNIIGSASSGGLLGLAAIGIMGLIVLNKKILQWKKPIAILLLIVLLIGGLTYQRWIPEFLSAAQGVIGTQTVDKADSDKKSDIQSRTADAEPGSTTAKIDFIQTQKRNIVFSINGNPLNIHVVTKKESTDSLELSDKDRNAIALIPTEEDFAIDDPRFYDFATITPTYIENTFYIIVHTGEMDWPFAIKNQIYYRNRIGNLETLDKVPSIGFENNLNFGNGRGYIWSRTIPMMKDTLLLGKGADTYCLYYPHNDYTGKYNAGWNVNMIVDKPHNMYMGIVIGTGGLSLIALLSLFGIYLLQSFKLYFRSKFETDFLTYVGAGIFFGICGFLTSALVNDSSVSVMPMFYGLLGTGISVNLILQKKAKNE